MPREKFHFQKRRPHKPRRWLSKPIHAKVERNGPNPEASILFAPFRYTHAPPPILSPLLAQNLQQMKKQRRPTKERTKTV